jgi:NADH-quinone oxidoreductase subunit N
VNVALLPEALVAAGILVVLLADAALPLARRGATVGIGALVLVAALVASLVLDRGAVEPGAVVGVDAMAAMVRPLLLGVALLALGLAAGVADAGAFTACSLGITLGALAIAGAQHLLGLWLGLETVSLASYALVAWRGGDRRAAEAGMKFVLFGGLASAFMLFGMSHVYGLTGRLDFAGIGAAWANVPAGAAWTALGLAAPGLAYKLTLVPFHVYAPDVWQGAPARALAAVGTAPKLAAAVVLARAVATLLPGGAAVGGAAVALAAVAGLGLAVGAVTAVAQRCAKRILAFSGIGHASAAVLALACLPAAGAAAAAIVQLAGYAVATLGALACLHVLEDERGRCDLDVLRGAFARRPWLVGALCLFLASLAGLPPLAGFLGKWAVLQQALGAGAAPGGGVILVAAVLLLVGTAIAAWAYLLVVRAVLLQDPLPAAATAVPPVPRVVAAVVVVCAVVTVGLGLWLDAIAAAAQALAAG